MSTPNFDEPDGQRGPATSEEGPAAPQHATAPHPQPVQGIAAYQPGPGAGSPPNGAPPYVAPGWSGEPDTQAGAVPEAQRTRLRVELSVAAVLAAVVAVLGLGLGPLWSAVAPWVPAVRAADGAVLAQPEQEQMIAAEGWYLGLTVLAGVLVAVLAWVVLRRYRGALTLVALAVGGVAAGLIAYKLGHNIGHAHAKNLADNAPVGTTFSIPPNLRVQQIGLWHGWLPYVKGDVLAMAIASVVTYLLLAGFSPYPGLRPEPAAAPDDADQPAAEVSSGL